MSPPGTSPFWLDILAVGLSLPENAESAQSVMKRESARTESQLAALSVDFRARLLLNLGLDAVLCDSDTPSRDRGAQAARKALEVLMSASPNGRLDGATLEVASRWVRSLFPVGPVLGAYGID